MGDVEKKTFIEHQIGDKNTAIIIVLCTLRILPTVPSLFWPGQCLDSKKTHLKKWKNSRWPGFEMANKSALRLLEIATRQFRMFSAIAMVFGHVAAITFKK